MPTTFGSSIHPPLTLSLTDTGKAKIDEHADDPCRILIGQRVLTPGTPRG